MNVIVLCKTHTHTHTHTKNQDKKVNNNVEQLTLLATVSIEAHASDSSNIGRVGRTRTTPENMLETPPVNSKHFRQKYKADGVLDCKESSIILSATRVTDALPVIMKIILKENLDKERLCHCQKEVMILKYLSLHPHDNVIQLLDEFEDQKRLVLVFQRFDCDLYELLESKSLGEKEAREVVRQLAAGIKHLHRWNIVHRDLKLDNILVDHRRNLFVIADFGLSSFCFGKRDSLKEVCGSPGKLVSSLQLITAIRLLGTRDLKQ